jgi:hypothetical protein
MCPGDNRINHFFQMAAVAITYVADSVNFTFLWNFEEDFLIFIHGPKVIIDADYFSANHMFEILCLFQGVNFLIVQ